MATTAETVYLIGARLPARPVDQLARQANRLADALTELDRATVLNAVVREAAGEEWFDNFDDNSYADGTAAAAYLATAAAPAAAPRDPARSDHPGQIQVMPDRQATHDRLNHIRSAVQPSRAEAASGVRRTERYRIRKQPTMPTRSEPRTQLPEPPPRDRDRGRDDDTPGFGR